MVVAGGTSQRVPLAGADDVGHLNMDSNILVIFASYRVIRLCGNSSTYGHNIIVVRVCSDSNIRD